MELRDQLARYQSHKVVAGGEIVSYIQTGTTEKVAMVLKDKEGLDINVELPPEVFARGWPQIGDFIAVYDDDYTSWSPRQAFIDGYTRIFGWRQRAT